MTNEGKQKISVVVPYYNDSKVFERCLTSIVNQTYKAYEILVVDDNSDDHNELLDIIKNFEGQIKLSLYRNEVNKNAAYSRNLGIKNSSGDVIALLDADDFWALNHLHVSMLSIKETDADFTYSNVIKVNTLGEEEKTKVDDVNVMSNPYDILFSSPPQTGSFVFIKSNCFDVKFNEELRRHQDYQFLIDMIRANKKIYFNDVYTTYYCESTRPFSTRVNFDSMFLFWDENKELFTGKYLKDFLIRSLCLTLRIKGAKKISYYVSSYPVFEIVEKTLFMKSVKLLGDNNALSKVALFVIYHMTYNFKNLPKLILKKGRVFLLGKVKK